MEAADQRRPTKEWQSLRCDIDQAASNVVIVIAWSDMRRPEVSIGGRGASLFADATRSTFKRTTSG
jgi:hypothetical protein